MKSDLSTAGASMQKEALLVGFPMGVTPSRHSRRRSRTPSGRAKWTGTEGFKVKLINRELPEDLEELRGGMEIGFRVMFWCVEFDWVYEEIDMVNKTDHESVKARLRKADPAGIRGRAAEEATASWAPWGQPQRSPWVTRCRVTRTGGLSSPTWRDFVVKQGYGMDSTGIANQLERDFVERLMKLILSLVRNKWIKTFGAWGQAVMEKALWTVAAKGSRDQLEGDILGLLMQLVPSLMWDGRIRTFGAWWLAVVMTTSAWTTGPDPS